MKSFCKYTSTENIILRYAVAGGWSPKFRKAEFFKTALYPIDHQII